MNTYIHTCSHQLTHGSVVINGMSERSIFPLHRLLTRVIYVVLKKKWMDAIRSGLTMDVSKVTSVQTTFKMDHFIQISVWTPSTSVHPDYTPAYNQHNGPLAGSLKRV